MRWPTLLRSETSMALIPATILTGFGFAEAQVL